MREYILTWLNQDSLVKKIIHTCIFFYVTSVTWHYTHKKIIIIQNWKEGEAEECNLIIISFFRYAVVVQNSQVRSSSTQYYYDLASPAAVFGGEDKLLKKSSGWMLNELKLRLSLFKKRDIDKWKEEIRYEMMMKMVWWWWWWG